MVARLGGNVGLCSANNGQDVGRRVPAHYDRPRTGAVHARHPIGRTHLPNRYELCSLLARLAHDEGKCIFFSTHELDIALSLADSIALIDPPQLVCLPTDEMRRSGCIERLFKNQCVSFDAAAVIKVRS